ncbi:hypothetical protein GCM10009716_47560 [Streptomyces sodiiphilus]|uniref:HTH luxR-type domain-containing protein n=2 Tax=Streptomyces sodiiphilus TaxID=226217 RepID=A0ABN2PWF8_9ACTN
MTPIGQRRRAIGRPSYSWALPLPQGCRALSATERLALACIACGEDTAGTARAMGIEAVTVRTLLRRATVKIGDGPSRTAVVHRAFLYGQLPAPVPLDVGTVRLEQWTVLHCLAAGMNLPQIAAQTSWSYRTVRAYAAALCRTLGARNLPHAIYCGWKAGYLGPAARTRHGET